MATTSYESRLDAAWAAARAEGRAALIPYFTAGFPDVEATLAALAAADEVSDIIEVGVPFSDPLADGPTIQRSTYDALRGGMTLARTLDLIERAALTRPVVVFSYLNPILRYGADRFLRDAAAAGASALLLTDLPAGADPALDAAVGASPLTLIRLVAPTTPAPRLGDMLRDAEGFVYLMARLGVTGASGTLAAGLAASVARVRAATSLPVAVGFGISTPAQAAAVAQLADGVVVGSALVEVMRNDGPAGADRFLRSLRTAIAGAAS